VDVDYANYFTVLLVKFIINVFWIKKKSERNHNQNINLIPASQIKLLRGEWLAGKALALAKPIPTRAWDSLLVAIQL